MLMSQACRFIYDASLLYTSKSHVECVNAYIYYDNELYSILALVRIQVIYIQVHMYEILCVCRITA